MEDIANLGFKTETDGLKDASDKLDGVSNKAKKAEDASEKLTSKFGLLSRGGISLSGTFGAIASGLAGIAAGVASFFAISKTISTFIDGTIEAENAQNALGAALKSTGGISGQTIQSLNDHAAALQKITNYGDDAINEAQKLMLTFTQIRGDVFPKATEAILNISQAMGQDLKSSALQVGKALNDPVAGISALARVGVSFSESQKSVIKSLVETGNVAEAQKLILKELEVEFGGAAVAARQTLGGALTSLNTAWGDLFELPKQSSEGLRLAIETLILAVQNPAFVQFAQTIGDLIFNALTLAVQGVTSFVNAISWLIDNAETVGVVLTGIAASQIPAVIGALATMTGGMNLAAGAATALRIALAIMGGPVGVIVGLLGGLAAAWFAWGNQANAAESGVTAMNATLKDNESKLLNAANATRAYRLELVELLKVQKIQHNTATELVGVELDAAQEKLTKLQDTYRNTSIGPQSSEMQRNLTARITETGKAADQLKEKFIPLALQSQVLADQIKRAEELADKKPFERIAAGATSAGGAAEKAGKKVKKATDEAGKALEKYNEQLQGIVQGGIGSFVDEMLGGFKNGMKGIINIFLDTIKQMIAFAITNPIPISANMSTSGSAVQAVTGGGAGAPGSGLLGGITGKIGGILKGFSSGLTGVVTNLFKGGLSGATGYIGTSLSGATASLAGFAQAAGALAAPIAAVVAAISFFKTKTTKLDQGLRITVNSMGVFTDKFETLKKTRFWGLSKKVKTSYSAADEQLAGEIQKIFDANKKTVSDFATGLGLSINRLKTFSTTISFSTMNAQNAMEAAQLISNAFGQITEQMAAQFKELNAYKRRGESYLQTLRSMSQSLSVVNEAFEALDYTLLDISLKSGDVARDFVDVFGSLDAFKSATSYYFENFYTQSEQLRFASDQLKTQFAEIGLTSETAAQAMSNLRSVVDQYAAQGQYEIVAKLIQLAPLYVKMKELEANAINKTTGALSRYLNLQNIFATRQAAIFAETSAGYTTGVNNINSSDDEIKALLREVVVAVREGDLNNARLTSKLVAIQSRVDLEPPT